MNFLKSLQSTAKILFFFVKKATQISKKSIIFSILIPLVQVVTRYSYVLFPSLIISEITTTMAVNKIIIYGIMMVFVVVFTIILNKRLQLEREVYNIQLCMGFQNAINDKIMSIKFENLEDPQFLDLRSEVIAAINDRQLIERIISNMQEFILQFVTIISFGIVLSTLNPLLVFAMILLALLNAIFSKKSKEINMNREKGMIAYMRRVAYFESLTTDFKIGKDARIFNIKTMIAEEIKKFNEKSFLLNLKSMRSDVHITALLTISEQLQMLIVYLYISYRVFTKAINIGDFTMYTGTAIQFGQSVFALANTIIDYRFIQYYVEKLYELLNCSEDDTELRTMNLKSDDIKIEFHNVSFTYPRAKEATLKNINVTISGSEHISIVGENGAGKTTFIKLLCGLYKPTEGTITINGEDIASIDQENYRKLISVVFQDCKLFSASVFENIAFNQSYDEEEIWKTLSAVGMDEKITKLPKYEETMVFRIFDIDGVEFSGGESQKITIARALYKKAPILILDEPTAALDPYAEYEMFETINNVSKGKLTVFISHRLSSCKFSDRILVFSNGTIIQDGSHEELMRQNAKLYKEMYMAQAQYYDMGSKGKC